MNLYIEEYLLKRINELETERDVFRSEVMRLSLELRLTQDNLKEAQATLREVRLNTVTL